MTTFRQCIHRILRSSSLAAVAWAIGGAMVVVMLSQNVARADVKLPAIIADHMVLQQKQKNRVWGWAAAGESVTVTLRDAKATTTANADGKWSVALEPIGAGGPFEMTVTGNNTITVKDVLVGEVWVCSGQSNMEWPVAASVDPQKEIAAADYPNIRLFTVAKKVSEKPLDDCTGSWSACSPRTVGGFSAVGYFFGRHLHKELDVPVGLVNSSWGGTIAEAWTSRGALESDADFKPILDRGAKFDAKNPNQPSVLCNGMLKPIIPYGIRGAIWYQGESNVGRAEQYKKLFPAMITDWRRQWSQGDFPFLFVQLAPYRYGGDPRQCAELWEAQLQTLSLANTGMAVTTDIGNVKDIHPRNKQDVGKRLATWALGTTYGKTLVYSGPLYESMSVEGGKIRVKFKHAGGGLTTKDGKAPSHFTIAGEDEKFVDATATIDGDSIVVASGQVSKPVGVRFGWAQDAEPNLFNKEGLPASPFRTDTFKMATAGRK